jgi:hypothetical protein
VEVKQPVRRLAYAALSAVFVSVFVASALAQAKHPGHESDCSTPADRCTEWRDLSSSAHSLEKWRETEARSGHRTSNYHYLEFNDPNGNPKKNGRPLRWASSDTSTTAASDGETTVTKQELLYDVGEIIYRETCQKNELPDGLVAETHTFSRYASATMEESGFFVQWSHDSTGEHISKERWGPGKRYVDDPSVKDSTRCSKPGFPFAFVRDPNLKPLG